MKQTYVNPNPYNRWTDGTAWIQWNGMHQHLIPYRLNATYFKPVYEMIGANMRDARIAAGHTRLSLRSISAIPEKRQLAYEKGERVPTLHDLIVWSFACDVSLSSLLPGDEALFFRAVDEGERYREMAEKYNA